MGTYTGMTGAQMVLMMRSMVGEPAEGFFQSDEIVRWLNLGQNAFCNLTKILSTSATSTSVATQKKYGLNDDFLIAQKVFYAGDKLSIKTDHQMMAISDLDNLDTTGTPRNAYFRGTADSGLCLFLYPVPGDTGDVITLWYRQRPDELYNTAASTSLLRPEYHMAPVLYAARMARLKRREINDAKELKKEYDELVTLALEFTGTPHEDEPKAIQDAGLWDYVGVGDDAVTEGGVLPS